MNIYKNEISIKGRNENTIKVSKKIREIIDSDRIKNDSLKLEDCFFDEHNITIAVITGGIHGYTDWERYFNDLSVLFSKLNAAFDEAWLVSLENDSFEGIHYAYIAVYDEEEEKEE